MAQLKDLLVNGKSRFLDALIVPSIKADSNGSNTKVWNTNGGIVDLTNTLSAYLPLSGGTMTGTIDSQIVQPKADSTYNLGDSGLRWNYGHFKNISIYSGDLNLRPNNSSSNDSADIAFYYGNGNEKARIWVNDTYTSSQGPNYRVYNTSGTLLYNGRLATTGELGNYLPLVGGTMSNTNLVTNLNADLLDGQHGSYYMPASKKYWANVELGTSASTATEPTFKTTTIQNDANNKCTMFYDSTEECMKFTFN